MTDLYGTFARDPVAVFLHAIEVAGRPVTFDEIKAQLIRDGLSEYSITSQWRTYERMVKDDLRVYYVPETRTYAWGPAVDLPDAVEAVRLLASGKAQINPDRRVLGDIVMAALYAAATPAPPPAPAPPPQQPPVAFIDPDLPSREKESSKEEAERQRIFEDRLRADTARAFAKVASELEELIASGASARALLQRIHAGAQAHGLSPIGSAGATIRFDRRRHDPVAATTEEGSEVMVVRPGYVWRTGSEEVLVAKAVVIEQ